MKYTIKYLAAITIFTTLFLFAPFCPNADAQISKKATSPDKEKLEVQKFVDSFIRSLEKTKDLNQVPERFFVADFKNRFANNYNWFNDSSNFFEQISDSERYEANVSIINFSSLGMMCSGGRDFDFSTDGNKDSEDKLDAEKLFPPQILDLVKKSERLNALFNDNSDSGVKNIAELLEMTADMKKVADAERIYLNENKSKWEIGYIKNIRKARKEFEWYKSQLCKGEDCDTLPDNTRVYYVTTFPFTISLIKQNNALKILDINFLDN